MTETGNAFQIVAAACTKVQSPATVGDSHKLQTAICTLNIPLNNFCNRIVNIWDNLPSCLFNIVEPVEFNKSLLYIDFSVALTFIRHIDYLHNAATKCKTRPAGRVRPATRFCPAREMFLSYNGNRPAASHRPPLHYTINYGIESLGCLPFHRLKTNVINNVRFFDNALLNA